MYIPRTAARSRWRLISLCAAAACALHFSAAAQTVAPPPYHVVNLGLQIAALVGIPEDSAGFDVMCYAMNGAGHVAGSFKKNGKTNAFFFDGMTVHDIGTIDGFSAAAVALNDRGDVAGWFRRDTVIAPLVPVGFFWNGGSRVDFDAFSPADINASGRVVGTVETRPDPLTLQHMAVMWDGSGFHTLGTFLTRTLGQGINDWGQVAGYAFDAQNFAHAFRWSSGVYEDLNPTQGPAGGLAINAAGTVVGEMNGHATVWVVGSTPRELGPFGEGFSIASDINNRGEVVFYTGSHDPGFVWDGTASRRLGRSLDASSGAWEIKEPRKINDAGQILAVGYGYNISNGAGFHHCLRLDPVLDQWHLQPRSVEPAGANVVAAWALTRGKGINIGIIDDGVDWEHPALKPNYVSSTSWDFIDNDPDPKPMSDAESHGTQVAGVAAANGTVVAGVAPEASLSGLRLLENDTTLPDDARAARAFLHKLDDIHIVNNSWGTPTNSLKRPPSDVAGSIENAIRDGRHGLGRIFVWGAGNGGPLDNCNFNGYANSRYGIAVGAVNDAGVQAEYSDSCSALFVTAPSGGNLDLAGSNRKITTTDLHGNYTTAFSGTSAAAPMVSGAVALMLSKNPNLTWRDVQYVLRQSSYRLQPNDSLWTAGPFGHNEKYGFGQLDVEAAVKLAAVWTNVPPEAALPEITQDENKPIPDDKNQVATSTITIGAGASDFVIEHVEVDFTAAHGRRGDLRVVLTHNGVDSTLATRRNDPDPDFQGWRFMSVRHWGSSPVGGWRLTVVDEIPQIGGTFNRWTLRIYGYRRAFTDDPLVPGATSIKAVHVTELQFRINEARTRCGLAPVPWTPIAAGTSVISSVHITEMRTALNAAHLACGRPPLSFTDATLTPGVVPIRAIHITELRSKVIALE